MEVVMATQVRSGIQDQNMNIHSKGNGTEESTRVLRSKKNASLGRKALADLSNSTKPCSNNARKMDGKRADGRVRKELGAYRPRSPIGGKNNAPATRKQSAGDVLRKDMSTKLNAFEGNVKTSKPLSPSRGKIDVFVEPSDLEQSSKLTFCSNVGMATTNEASENSDFTAKSKEGSRQALAVKSGNDFGEKIVQKMASSSLGSKSSVQKSVPNHICNGKGRAGGRKALADISNSTSTNLQEASRLSDFKNIKSIADEQFLHDHQKCINMQKREMDMSSIFRTLGLDDGPSRLVLSSTVLPDELKDKIETPFKKWEDLDLTELQDEVQTPYKCTSPELLDLSSPDSFMSHMHRNYDMSPKFTLIDTPLEK